MNHFLHLFMLRILLFGFFTPSPFCYHESASIKDTSSFHAPLFFQNSNSMRFIVFIFSCSNDAFCFGER
jgi:hypothetical protein